MHQKLNHNLLVLLPLIILGIYLCYIGGYGSDEDTLAMINSFGSVLYNGFYQSSRFTGYPVAEIIIGFFSISWKFLYKFSCFFIFCCKPFFIFLTFENSVSFTFFKKKLILFIIFCLSNPIYFDNIEPVDYSLAFLFFSLGSFFYSKKLFQLSYIFFIVALGTRLNFAVFVILFIFF